MSLLTVRSSPVVLIHFTDQISGGFLHYFTEDFAAMDKFLGTGWANTEFRSYTFDTHDADNAHLIETQESRQRRDQKPLDREEKTNLKRASTDKAASATAIQAKV